MATVKSLGDTVGVLKENPVIFLAGVLYTVIVTPQTALSTFGIPLVPELIQMVTSNRVR